MDQIFYKKSIMEVSCGKSWEGYYFFFFPKISITARGWLELFREHVDCLAIKCYFLGHYLKGLAALKCSSHESGLMPMTVSFFFSLSPSNFVSTSSKNHTNTYNLFPIHTKIFSFWLPFFLFWISNEITNIF